MIDRKTYPDIKEMYVKKTYPEFKVPGKAIQPSTKPMIIVIPTLGRTDNQRTFKTIPEELLPRTYLVTKECEAAKLKELNPTANVRTIPDETNGIADTRQQCLELFPDHTKIWMIDDSSHLDARRENNKLCSFAMQPKEFVCLFEVIEYLLDYYPQVGVSDRPGNNWVEDWKCDLKRSYTTYGLRTDVLKELEIGFDDLYKKYGAMFYEDYYLTLALFRKGYANTVIYDFVSSVQQRNRKGGNSLFRNNERLKKSVEALQQEFPGYVSQKIVTSNNWQGDLGEERIEPRIQWKKVFTESQKKKPKRLF